MRLIFVVIMVVSVRGRPVMQQLQIFVLAILMFLGIAAV